MSNISLLKISSVKFNNVIKGASLSDIKSYFKNYDQTNISEAFNATKNKQKEVITAEEWTAFTKKFYNLQVESQSGFKSLIKYLDKKNEEKWQKNEPISQSIDFLTLKSAIKDYNENRHKSAYGLFKHLTCEGSENTTNNEEIQIYSISMYYIALCYLNSNNEPRALGVPKFLEKYKKYSDAFKVYNLLYSEAKVAEIKDEAFLNGLGVPVTEDPYGGKTDVSKNSNYFLKYEKELWNINYFLDYRVICNNFSFTKSTKHLIYKNGIKKYLLGESSEQYAKAFEKDTKVDSYNNKWFAVEAFNNKEKRRQYEEMIEKLENIHISPNIPIHHYNKANSLIEVVGPPHHRNNKKNLWDFQRGIRICKDSYEKFVNNLVGKYGKWIDKHVIYNIYNQLEIYYVYAHDGCAITNPTPSSSPRDPPPDSNSTSFIEEVLFSYIEENIEELSDAENNWETPINSDYEL
ncbi:29770_t:CDS:2, partial [Gigaspora margarita]